MSIEKLKKYFEVNKDNLKAEELQACLAVENYNSFAEKYDAFAKSLEGNYGLTELHDELTKNRIDAFHFLRLKWSEKMRKGNNLREVQPLKKSVDGGNELCENYRELTEGTIKKCVENSFAQLGTEQAYFFLLYHKCSKNEVEQKINLKTTNKERGKELVKLFRDYLANDLGIKDENLQDQIILATVQGSLVEQESDAASPKRACFLYGVVGTYCMTHWLPFFGDKYMFRNDVTKLQKFHIEKKDNQSVVVHYVLPIQAVQTNLSTQIDVAEIAFSVTMFTPNGDRSFRPPKLTQKWSFVDKENELYNTKTDSTEKVNLYHLYLQQQHIIDAKTRSNDLICKTDNSPIELFPKHYVGDVLDNLENINAAEEKAEKSIDTFIENRDFLFQLNCYNPFLVAAFLRDDDGNADKKTEKPLDFFKDKLKQKWGIENEYLQKYLLILLAQHTSVKNGNDTDDKKLNLIFSLPSQVVTKFFLLDLMDVVGGVGKIWLSFDEKISSFYIEKIEGGVVVNYTYSINLRSSYFNNNKIDIGLAQFSVKVFNDRNKTPEPTVKIFFNKEEDIKNEIGNNWKKGKEEAKKGQMADALKIIRILHSEIIDDTKGVKALNFLIAKGTVKEKLKFIKNNTQNSFITGNVWISIANLITDNIAVAEKEERWQDVKNLEEALDRFLSNRWRPFGVNFVKEFNKDIKQRLAKAKDANAKKKIIDYIVKQDKYGYFLHHLFTNKKVAEFINSLGDDKKKGEKGGFLRELWDKAVKNFDEIRQTKQSECPSDIKAKVIRNILLGLKDLQNYKSQSLLRSVLNYITGFFKDMIPYDRSEISVLSLNPENRKTIRIEKQMTPEGMLNDVVLPIVKCAGSNDANNLILTKGNNIGGKLATVLVYCVRSGMPICELVDKVAEKHGKEGVFAGEKFNLLPTETQKFLLKAYLCMLASKDAVYDKVKEKFMEEYKGNYTLKMEEIFKDIKAEQDADYNTARGWLDELNWRRTEAMKQDVQQNENKGSTTANMISKFSGHPEASVQNPEKLIREGLNLLEKYPEPVSGDHDDVDRKKELDKIEGVPTCPQKIEI